MKKKKEVKSNIFYSFLNATILNRGERKKFKVVFNIPIYDKANYIFGHSDNITPKNIKSLLIIYSGYFIFWFASLYVFFYFLKNLRKEYLKKKNRTKKLLYKNIINIDTFYYFFQNYFNDFFNFNIYLYNISESYTYDLFYTELLINIYNINFYHSLDIFFLLLNMDALKYEHEQYLTPKKDWDKIRKRILNHFDSSILNYSNSFFNTFYITESYKIFKTINFNWINYNFFDIYFLFNNCVNEFDFFFKKMLDDDIMLEEEKSIKDEVSLLLRDERLDEKLDLYSVDLEDFKLIISLDFFLVFNFYTIYLRRLRFNYYMRNLIILNEYQSLKYLFILVNNPFGKNMTQVDILEYQKIYTLEHYNSNTSQESFNAKFKFFFSKFSRRKWLYIHDKKLDFFSFDVLLNSEYANFTFKLNDTQFKGLKDLLNSRSKFLMYNFIYESIDEIMEFTFYSLAFKLLMRFKSVFKFALTDTTYLELCDFVDVIYTSPMALLRFYFDLQKNFFNNYYYYLYSDNFIMPNFFKDFCFLYKNNNYYFYFYKLTSFFIKIYILIICGIDIFFLEHYQYNFFYKWTWPYLFFSYYASIFFIYYSIKKIKKITYEFILEIETLMLHLNWKLNISPYTDYEHLDLSIFFYTHGLVDAVSFSRFNNFYKKTLFYFKYNNVRVMYLNFKYSLHLKNIYFVLLYENIEYTLIFFFFNLNKILDIFKNKYKESMSECLNATFVYRYYYLMIILDYDRYKNWFEDWTQREFWIFYYWNQYEGYEFYKKRSYL